MEVAAMEGDPPAEVVAISSLTGQCLAHIFSHLEGTDLAAASQVNRQWRDFLLQEEGAAPWARACAADYLLGAPESPDGAALPSFRAAYAAWHSALARYGEAGRRARAAWAALEAWTRAHFPEAHASLRPGASEEALDQAEAALGVPLPPALRALYRLHDGQALEFDRQIDSGRTEMHASIFHGLFGGYSFYSHLVSTRLLPLRRMVRWTPKLTRRMRSPSGAERSLLLFAANYNFNKALFCDAATGGVRIASAERFADGCITAIPHVDGARDGVLRWLEAYAGALGEGRFRVEALDPEDPETRGISLFPQGPPWQSEAVTRGVRVRASSVFVPELTQTREGDPLHFFAYNIRLGLLSEEEQAAVAAARGGASGAARPLRAAQLRTRHWLIRGAEGGVESEVKGEAVVGHYPLLMPGEPDFIYQSCTHQMEATGSMEGGFGFAEGSLAAPVGEDFHAACALFRLDVPEVVF